MRSIYMYIYFYTLLSSYKFTYEMNLLVCLKIIISFEWGWNQDNDCLPSRSVGQSTLG